MRYKILDLKGVYITLFIISLTCSNYAQKTLKTFEGDLMFKESYYYFALSRTAYDTVHLYYNYEVKKTINIKKFVPINSFDTEDRSFLPILFFRKGDSLFFKYQEKYSSAPDTVVSKLFPLSFKDTIEVPFCYRISEDTIRWTDKKRTLEIKTDCDGDDDEIKTYRLNDTTLMFKDYKLECYCFEQKGRVGYYKDLFFTRKILVEKSTLIPIDVKEYNFHTVKRPRYRNKNREQNLLTFHKKLISIE